MPTLNWLTRDEDLKVTGSVPYRLLEEETEWSHGAADSGNLLVHGDNLAALKALLPFYAGQVKCVFIDPPYNTGSAFEHYDDNVEHAKWLSMMYPRLELLRELLADNGSIWVTIDDAEAHYLKVVMDEVFGRKNFVATVLWRKNYAPKGTAKHLSVDHDYIFIYAQNEDAWRPNLMPRTDKQNKAYKNMDNDPRGLWRPNNLAARNFYSKGMYPITCPSGRVITGPPKGSYWRVSEEKFRELDADGRIWWGHDGNNVPAPKIYLSEVKQGITPQTWWSYEEVGHTQDAKKEIVVLFGDDVFGTPKPERLIQRILEIATVSGDLVLDSFLGSGTTAAVAHKMGRHYLGIEMGEHAKTHCAARLKKVADGEQGGISKAVGWQGGGGFRFFKLGAEVFDADGHINSGIRFGHLAAHIWFSETKTPFTPRKKKSPFLGVHDGTGYALLYNGILGDRTVSGGNVLTTATLALIKTAADGEPYQKLVVYGESSRLGMARRKAVKIDFKQTPYDVKAR